MNLKQSKSLSLLRVKDGSGLDFVSAIEEYLDAAKNGDEPYPQFSPQFGSFFSPRRHYLSLVKHRYISPFL